MLVVDNTIFIEMQRSIWKWYHLVKQELISKNYHLVIYDIVFFEKPWTPGMGTDSQESEVRSCRKKGNAGL